MSGHKSLSSFINCFVNFSVPPDFGMVFDVAKRNGRFGCIQCQRSRESSSRGKKRQVFLCRKAVQVKVEGKAIPASFLKIEERGTLIGVKDQRKGDSRIDS